jgi:hypothetical protein
MCTFAVAIGASSFCSSTIDFPSIPSISCLKPGPEEKADDYQHCAPRDAGRKIVNQERSELCQWWPFVISPMKTASENLPTTSWFDDRWRFVLSKSEAWKWSLIRQFSSFFDLPVFCTSHVQKKKISLERSLACHLQYPQEYENGPAAGIGRSATV